MITAAVGFILVFILLFLGIPIGFGLTIVGVGGFAHLIGWDAALSMLGQLAYDTPMSYSLTVVPLFILMGNFIASGGLAEDLYNAAYAFLGHLRGGLSLATFVACAGFSAMCGSSLATAATMAKVAMPPMRKYHYSDKLAAGSIAAGGTLGILIPPSVILVIYGIMTNNDIGKLFIAGIIPGLLGLLLYMAAAVVVTWINPSLGMPGERSTMRKRMRALGRTWGILVLFAVVIGGIYFGVFTPTEAAAIGASGAFIFALGRRTLTIKRLIEILVETAHMTAMIFVIIIGAFLFSNFINVAGLSTGLANWVKSINASPMVIIFTIMGIYVVLGCIFESMSMLFLTVPIFYPLVTGLGFDPIWFGIIVVVIIEISLITPPIGLNVFVLKASLPDIRTYDIFYGLMPFLLADIVRMSLLVLWPSIILFLPGFMN